MAIASSDGSIIITTKLDVTPVSKALNALKSKFASLKEQRSAIQTLTTAIKDQQSVIKDLEKEYAILVAQGKGNSTNAEELKARIAELKAELQQLTGAASAMGVKTAAASTKAAQGLKKLGERIAGIVKSALIFSVLYKVMQAVVKIFQNILMSDEEFRQDWEELKAAFYTAAYPIVNLIVPAIKYIVQQVRDWAVSIGKVAAALQGMSYSELVDQAKASKEAADNYADMEKSSKKTADNVKKQLASFDDIQILSSGNEEEQGAGLAGFEGLAEYDTSGEKSMLDDLMTAIGSALAAVGLILLFKGQIGWGVGFLVAGAAFWAIGEIWGEDYDPNSAADVLNNIMQTIGVSLAAIGIILITKGILTWGFGFLIAGAAMWAITEFVEGEFSTDPVVNTLVKIMGIAGTALLALGIILCVFGVITPVSIGLIVAGAGLLVGALALSNEAIVEAIRGPIGIIAAIVSGALLVLGIILTCSGMLPLGIGLIAAGAIGLATVVAINWNAILEALQGPIGTITAIVSGALLVLGIILVCTGVGIPLGIGLIIAGAAGLATVVAINWNYIYDSITSFIKDNSGLIVGVSLALIVLGIILLFTGVGIPLAIGLIVAGGGALAATVALNWNFIVDKVKEVWQKVKDFWNENIAPIFTKEWWLNLGKTVMNGLIAGFESGINGIIGMFEKMINWIVDGLNKISFDVPDWVPGIGGKTFGFNIPKATFGRVSIPRLAQGAVIPPNREFLAVLGDQRKGTNIETPLATMVEAFQMALDSRGGYSGGNTEVILEIDGREFGRAVVEQGNRENRRIGTRLVIA